MAETPTSTSRDRLVRVRFFRASVDKIDAMRGNWTLSEYVRRAVAKAINEGMTGPNSNGDRL